MVPQQLVPTNCRLAGTVGSDDNVEVRSQDKFSVTVLHEIGELYPEIIEDSKLYEKCLSNLQLLTKQEYIIPKLPIFKTRTQNHTDTL